MTDNTTSEFSAFQQVHNALVGLDDEARSRVITSVATLLGIGTPTLDPRKPGEFVEQVDDEVDDGGVDKVQETSFSEFAELYAATNPGSNADKALVAGYWLQVCQGVESFTAQVLNAELNHLGHKLTHVTDALSQLIAGRPQLVLQLRKSGKTKQARKTYKLSAEGIKRVKEMIGAA